tara:strand:+ start:1326 stop:2972 length:1647 start_codon:yes stop_codon:yes gene_type:complete
MNNPLLQKASIVLSPTAYGTGILNSIKPVQSFGTELVTNGTFDTDSNWTKNNATISGGKANFDIVGGAYAKLEQSITYVTGRKYRLTAVVNGTDGKAMRFRDDTGNSGGLTSSNGNLTMTGSDQSVTFEWTANANSDEIAIERHTTSGDYTFTVDNVSIKEIIDANFDFERNTTATRVNESELIETVVAKVPRINYTSKVGCVLLEPSRTNNYTHSNDFTNTYWTKQNSITVSSNQTTSPEGIVNADKLVSANATSEQYLDNTSISTSSGDDITVSCFVKKLDYDYFHIRFTGVGGVFTAASVWYNIDNGTLGTVESGITAKIEDYGNGWYRCSATRTATGTGNGKIRLQLASSDNSANVVGDGTKGTFIYGAQWEVGSSATSLIDTSGSTVTRSADAPSGAGSNDLINSSEGVLYAEIGALEDDLTFRVLSVSDGSNDNTVKFGYRSDSNRIYAEVRSGSSSQAFLSYDVSDITDFHKVAVKYKVNDFALWVDGVERATDTSGSVSIGLNTARFDNGGGANDFYGKVKVLAVFKEALTDAELTTLTS